MDYSCYYTNSVLKGYVGKGVEGADRNGYMEFSCEEDYKEKLAELKEEKANELNDFVNRKE